MVSIETGPETMAALAGKAHEPAKAAIRPGSWLVPGEQFWEVREPKAAGGFSLLRAIDDAEDQNSRNGQGAPPPGIALVALPEKLVTCQLFWLETTDEKAVPDLLRMQCERRALLRQGEVWTHRILRCVEGRLLVQVLILGNAVPPILEVEGEARFEALARCLDVPPHSACLWRSLGTMALALTGEAGGVVYFQSLPHQALTRECRGDVQAILWMALAQNWVSALESVALFGEWRPEDICELETLGYSIILKKSLPFAMPKEPMELVPKSVRHLRLVRRRQQRIRLAAWVFAAVYIAFLAFQIVSATLVSISNRRLQARLDKMLPTVTALQNTARRLDALNPALDTGTYPMEILHRVMASLPESGVRLTRFEIVNDRVEVGGEASSTREAFDFLQAIQSTPTLNHIQWEDPPQPVPLPNDTARFSIRGTITGAYHHAEEL